MEQKLFFRAVSNGNMDDMIQQLVTGKVDVTKVDPNEKQTALDIASKRGDKEILKILIMAIPPNNRTEEQWNFLLQTRREEQKVTFSEHLLPITTESVVVDHKVRDVRDLHGNTFMLQDYETMMTTKKIRNISPNYTRNIVYQKAQDEHVRNYNMCLSQLDMLRKEHEQTKEYTGADKMHLQDSLRTAIEAIEEDAAKYLSLMDDITVAKIMGSCNQPIINLDTSTNDGLKPPPAPPPMSLSS